MKLRLTNPSFAKYTGQMGVVYFQDGLSVQDVHPNDAIRIAGSIGAEWENGAPANVGDIYTQNMNTPAPTVEQQNGMAILQSVVGLNADQAMKASEDVANAQTGMKAGDRAEKAVERAAEIKAEIETEAEAPAEAAADGKYTAASLAEIADQNGIVGLREIANTYGVTGNSIMILIERILAKQG